MMGWMCPNCGSAHAPSVTTCPMQIQTATTYDTNFPTHWPTPDTGACPQCHKKRGGLSIPRMGLYEVDRCVCPIASTADGDGK